MQTIATLLVEETATIVSSTYNNISEKPFLRRFLHLGLLPGRLVTLKKDFSRGKGKGPFLLEFNETLLALTQDEASMIQVEKKREIYESRE